MRGTVAKRLRRSVNNKSPDEMGVTNVRDIQTLDHCEWDDVVRPVMRTVYQTCTFERPVHTRRRQYQLTKENYLAQA